MNSFIEREQDVQNLTRLRDLIAQGADVNAFLLTGWTPLCFAAKIGLAEQCRVLLEAGADPQCGDQLAQRSPLYEAIYHRLNRGISDAQLTAVCEVLFSHGANPNGIELTSTRRTTMFLPLYGAATTWDGLAIDLLAAAGADLDRKCQIQRRGGQCVEKTALSAVRDTGNQDIMVQLLRLGANDAALGRGNATPFQESVLAGRDKLVEFYVRERGESLDQEINGKRPEDATLSTLTRETILTLKTEMAVQRVLAVDGPAQEAVSARKPIGMAL